MEKMKKLKLFVASGLAVVSMLGGVFVSAQYTKAENAPEAQTASSLWETVDGITLENNVDVPDYMKYGKYALDYNDPENMVEVLTDDKQNLSDWELNGLKMTSTVENQSITYKHTLDLNGLSSSDEFLTFAPIPVTRGTQDYASLVVTLQDADDEDNYLKISLSRYILWVSGTKFQVETPEIGPTDRNLYLGAFNGLTQDARGQNGMDVRTRPVRLRYDVNTKIVSVVCEAGQKKDLVDLDDESVVGYGKAWKGFKNNRVKLTITMGAFEAASAQLMVLNVCEQGMNGATLSDTSAPKFSFAEDANAMPKAKVGKKYPLSNVQCLDVVSGPTAYNCTITSPSGKSVEIVDDGFIPTENGYYKLAYTATDVAGNVANKELQVFATNALPPITVASHHR